MIRIFHPKHGYLLVTDDAEKKRLLETGGYISESFSDTETKTEQNEEQTEEQPIQSRQNEEITDIVDEHNLDPRDRKKKLGRPKKWR